MFKYKQISEVFNYRDAISINQIKQRSFVDRADYKERLSNEIFQNGVLIVSGYSSIGKTSLVNLATSQEEFRKMNALFRSGRIVRVFANSDLRNIYNEMSRYISGKAPEAFTPSILAELIHTNQILLIIEGVHELYDNKSVSKDLFNLCKIWTDLPKSIKVQSKIVLVASGFPNFVDQWLNRIGSGTRLPRVHIKISPWSSEDLLKIIEFGSQLIGITFDIELQKWMSKIACGLPSTMTLLASLTACHANNGSDKLFGNPIDIELSDLYGILGESDKFREILLPNDKIETLSIPGLFAIYLLGINRGRMNENVLMEYLKSYGFFDSSIQTELTGLISIEHKDETVFWNINELSYGTFAFLRLYYRSKLSNDEAEEIQKALTLLSEVKIQREEKQQTVCSIKMLGNIQGGKTMISILFLAADPTDACRLRLGEEFREIQEKLKLAKLRDRFKLELPQLSVRPPDIAQALLDTSPQIVHFSGHGTSTGALCFENQVGETHFVQPDALAALFEQFTHQVNCVLLNACYAEVQAKAISKHIEYVIGMNQSISDKAAIAFSIGFYQAIGAGRTIEDAYKLGCVQIRLQGIPEHLTPVLIKKE